MALFALLWEYLTGTSANCTPSPIEGYPDYYVSCKDVYSNEQTTSQNIDFKPG